MVSRVDADTESDVGCEAEIGRTEAELDFWLVVTVVAVFVVPLGMLVTLEEEEDDKNVYGTVVPLVEIQPYVGENVVVSQVLWTVTVVTGTDFMSADATPSGSCWSKYPELGSARRMLHTTAHPRCE